jgi:hypothetical protein
MHHGLSLRIPTTWFSKLFSAAISTGCLAFDGSEV